MQCTGCNAQLQPDERRCSFCGAATPLAVREAEEAHLKGDASEQARRAGLDAAQRRAGQQALIWSAVGLMFCFFLPLPAVVGAVLAMRARSVAREAGTVATTSATVALALSAVSAVVFALVVVAVLVANLRASELATTLRAQVASGAARDTLDQATACGLTQLYLLENGYGETGGVNIGHFECDGRLTQGGDHAALEDVHFTFSAERTRATERVCLRRGERWFVAQLGGCP